jgi:hypothetical protein
MQNLPELRLAHLGAALFEEAGSRVHDLPNFRLYSRSDALGH